MELSNSISNEHNDETSFEINYELANTRMYCRDLEYRLKNIQNHEVGIFDFRNDSWNNNKFISMKFCRLGVVSGPACESENG